ncbi:MAG: M1 family peptidase, partial [Pyrinomonadaceae bacterium]
DWFFEIYMRQPKLPKLETKTSNGKLELRWDTPNDLPFPMPIDVVISGKTQRVEMKNGKGSVAFAGAAPIIDPDWWVLKAQ